MRTSAELTRIGSLSEIQREIRRSSDARYDHRLHAILLVAGGLSPREIARLLGDSPRTVALWVQRFVREGLGGLVEADRPGRPPRLTEEQLEAVDHALRGHPSDHGLTGSSWDGKTLAAFIRRQWGVDLGVRQCQRILRRLAPRPGAE